jgi:hypothetical protein
VTLTLDTAEHWDWVRDLINEATADVEPEPVTCHSCGRKLTNAASIARGRGPKCAAKVSRAARLVADLIDDARSRCASRGYGR